MAGLSFSERDTPGEVVFYVLLKKRNGISVNLFDDYWKDVHGPVCARLPGQFQYWQFHLGHNVGGFWPKVEGVEFECSEDDQYDGIAELTFRSSEDRNAWFTSAAILMDDEHNIFSKAVGYVTNKGNSRTYVDGSRDGEPNGDGEMLKFHVMLKKLETVSVEKFRSYVSGQLVPAMKKSELLMKLRGHLLEEHDNSEKLPPAPGVSHFESPEKQYQAALEIGFRNHMDMEAFFASNEYVSAMKDLSRHVRQVVAFPERNAYTFVYNGEMTMAGERGSSTAAIIAQAGATNQLRDNIRTLMLGRG